MVALRSVSAWRNGQDMVVSSVEEDAWGNLETILVAYRESKYFVSINKPSSSTLCLLQPTMYAYPLFAFLRLARRMLIHSDAGVLPVCSIECTPLPSLQ